MHVLISCVGSAGDVHPFIAIGLALQARGHQVALFAAPQFGPRIEAAGLDFAPFGTAQEYDRILSDADLWHPRRGFGVLWQALQPRLVDAHAALLARVQPRCTVLVGSTLAWPMRLLQETHGVPAVTVHLSPVCLFSAHAPARIPGWFDMSAWPTGAVRFTQRVLERCLIDPMVDRGFDPIRRRLGLAPVRRVFSHWIHSPDAVVCAWPDWYAPHQIDWPVQAVTTGFARWCGSDSPLDAVLCAFLDAGPPPVGITPGSAMAHGRRFFERALAACGAIGARALIVTPYADQLPQPLPSFVHAVGYAPFDRLLPRLGALVHHGGIGTTAQAFAAGVPQAVVPFAHDQFDNAARVAALGVGVQLRLSKPAHVWAAGLHRLMNDGAIAVRCAQQAASMQDRGAALAKIADVIECVGRANAFSQ